MAKSSDRRYLRRNVVKLAASATAMAALATTSKGALSRGAAAPGRQIRVEDLDLTMMRQAGGMPQKNKDRWGKPLQVGGKTYKHGIGTSAANVLRIKLHRAAVEFTTKVGLNDDSGNQHAVVFKVIVDGKIRACSPVLRVGDPAYLLRVNLRGAAEMIMLADQASTCSQALSKGRTWGMGGWVTARSLHDQPAPWGSTLWDQADWLDPVITLAAGTRATPVAVPYPGIHDYPEIASGDPETPEFHGPRVVGATPGRDFLFQIPYTGKLPVTVSADNLPPGLQMDPSGLITGKIAKAGEYKVRLTAKNALGSARRTLRLVAGEHKLALTPLMGWESWNAYGLNNSAERTRSATDALVKSGLAAKGFNYVIIDEGWQDGRSADGELKSNDKFGDLKQLADYVHHRGLRIGIYSSPGPKTCAGNVGSFGHEFQDAKTFSRWGMDYLKYDWCSYGSLVPRNADLAQLIKPYQLMRAALDQTDRDIFYSMCQYGIGHVWTWGGQAPVWGNSWRISGDIDDSWAAVSFNGFDSDGNLFPFAGPGHWNDPDMLVVGYGFFEDGGLHWTRLTPHEQLTHITLWCILAAPLLLGCVLEKLDKFTTDLMTNTEVLAVNQDELGVQAQCVDRQGSVEIWARPLWDGTVAVAIFNRGMSQANVAISSWHVLDPAVRNRHSGLSGKQPVRDLWKRKDLGKLAAFNASIAMHGAIMLKVGAPSITED